MKYRAKPVEIEAVQLCWKNWSDVCALVADAISEENPARYMTDPQAVSDACDEQGPFIELTLTTMHGERAVFRHGDFIIPDGKPGTFYPCKPDVFRNKYEAA